MEALKSSEPVPFVPASTAVVATVTTVAIATVSVSVALEFLKLASALIILVRNRFLVTARLEGVQESRYCASFDGGLAPVGAAL